MKIERCRCEYEIVANSYYSIGFDALICNPFVGWEGGLDGVFAQWLADQKRQWDLSGSEGLGEEIVRDFISGFFIIFEESFNVDDVIEVDGFKGHVLSLGLRTTRIQNGQNRLDTSYC